MSVGPSATLYLMLSQSIEKMNYDRDKLIDVLVLHSFIMGATMTFLSSIKVGFIEHVYSQPCILAYISTASAVIAL
mgnify:CR=1 FL=1